MSQPVLRATADTEPVANPFDVGRSRVVRTLHYCTRRARTAAETTGRERDVVIATRELDERLWCALDRWLDDLNGRRQPRDGRP